MTKIPAFFLLPLLLIACKQEPTALREAPSRTDGLSAEQAAQQLVKDAFDAVWSELDTAKLLDFHTEDFLLLEHGLVWSNDSIRHYQLLGQKRKEEQGYQRINRFEFFDGGTCGDEVWVAYHNYGTWKKDNDTLFTVQWLESVVAVETEEGWKLRMMHSTRMPSE